MLCPPLGFEFIAAYRTYRRLAEALADRGFLVLRFDYDGTGDSAGAGDDPDRQVAWEHSVVDAIAQIRAWGVQQVGVVGMRYGAALALAGAMTSGGVETLVLWDAVTTGKRYLRELSLLHRTAFGSDDGRRPDGSLDAVGMWFAAPTFAAIESFDLAAVRAPLATYALVAARAGREPSAAQLAALRDACAKVDALVAEGQERVIDLNVPATEVPTVTLAAIADWLDAHHTADRHPLVPAPIAPIASVGATRDGRPIFEEARQLGERGLFGMATYVDGSTGPWIVCLNNGAGHHVGPQRLWVDLARLWAGAGQRVLRLDISGFGDSPWRERPVPEPEYPPDGVEQVVGVLRSLRPEDPHDALLVGLCSGAYIAVDTAATFGVRSILAANPYLNHKPAHLVEAAADGTVARGAHSALPVRRIVPWLRTLSIHSRLERAIPPVGWFLLDRARIHSSPMRGVERALSRGTNMTLLFVDSDALAQLERRGKWSIRRLRRHPALRIENVPGDDHSLMLQRSRDDLGAALTAAVERTLEGSRA